MSTTTRAGEYTSGQIAKMGAITNLTASDFSISGVAFQIKNDGLQAVYLDLQLWGMDEGTYVNTLCEVGWNSEMVKKVKQNVSAGSYNLKWGY